MNTRLLRSYSSVARAARDRVRVGAIVLCAVLLLTAMLPVARAATMPTAASAPTPSLQFTAGGHIIGFQPTQVVMASLDHALRIEFVGTAGVTPVAAGAPGEGRTLGRAQPLGVVTYPNVWRGIRVEYRASEAGIVKSTYTIAPGADAAQIRLRYNVPVELQSDGSLQFPFGHGYISESAPMAWQEIDGARVPVQVAFRLLESADANLHSAIENRESEIGFRLGAYDPRYPLTIDPNYVWHTFYGSPSDWDEGRAIAVDADGNVYVTGSSRYTWQGDGNADPIHAYSGEADICVLKLNSAGAYQWHTFYGSAYGGVVDDAGLGIAVDANGNVYVTGTTGPASWQGDGDTDPLHPYSGGADIFVLKLNTNGVYQWHTFYGYGESYYDGGHGIAVDGSGNVYITGSSSNTWQGDGGASPLHAHSGSYDIVVLKLDSSGVYGWHTFYGSASGDWGDGIAVDGSGNAYITGKSLATWQGDGNASPIHPYTGYYDIIVLKLNSSGAYQWHTFYGSASEEDGYGIAVDGSNNVYITGDSRAAWQGDGNANPLHPYSGGSDIFVLKLNSSGVYQWHTFYGSASGDVGYGIAVDSSSNVYITGVSFASWGSPIHAYSGQDDICVLKLNSSGAYQWHTFYGSANEERGRGIAVAGSGNVYVTGKSYDTAWQGDNNADPLHPYSGEGDIFVLKMVSTLPPSGSMLYLPLIRRDAP